MSQLKIKQIKGLTAGSILFLNSTLTVSEDYSKLNWNYTNNSLNVLGSINSNNISVTGTASISGNLILNRTSGTNETDILVIDNSGNVKYRSLIPVTVNPVSGVHTFNLSTGTNFKTNASGSMTLAFTNLVVGQAGTIMIYNSASISPQPLPSYVYTPNGFSIDWVVTSGVISMISYYVYDNTGLGKVLINYVGDFKST